MKKILTAIGNSTLNDKIKTIEGNEVLTEDITNDEELLEVLEREEIVEILFLCKNIINHYTTNEFIELIRKIHHNIFIVLFNGNQKKEKIEEDETLKLYDSMDLDLNTFDKIFQKKNVTNIQKYTSKVISISGANGIGKSTFSTFLAKNVENKDVKILLIDFNLDENHIKTILKLRKTPIYTGNIKSLIVPIHKNLDMLCDLKLVFSNEQEVNFFAVQKMIAEFKEEYNLIIIDTSSKIENDYTKRIFYNSEKVIFLVEPNILGIKKAKDMLEVIENDWRISTEKIKIVLNKTTLYEISESIIQELFSDIKIIGKMKYHDSYNLMINKDIHKKEIKKEYEKIYGKMKIFV